MECYVYVGEFEAPRASGPSMSGYIPFQDSSTPCTEGVHNYILTVQEYTTITSNSIDVNDISEVISPAELTAVFSVGFGLIFFLSFLAFKISAAKRIISLI